MAYEYDRFEREDGGGSFLMGLLAGTVLGAGLGMLFAPKAGSELRNQLSEQTGQLRRRRTTPIPGVGKVTRWWIAAAKPTIAPAPRASEQRAPPRRAPQPARPATTPARAATAPARPVTAAIADSSSSSTQLSAISAR